MCRRSISSNGSSRSRCWSGPSSQILAEPVVAVQEIDDEKFTAHLRRMTKVLRSKSGTGAGGDASAFAAL